MSPTHGNGLAAGSGDRVFDFVYVGKRVGEKEKNRNKNRPRSSFTIVIAFWDGLLTRRQTVLWNRKTACLLVQ